jgi:hypothetical protein
MPDLNFRVDAVEPQLYAAAPALIFKLNVSESLTPDLEPTRIYCIALRCQIRIEPSRRSYTPSEKQRLRDLFGTPDRWGQTLRAMLWTHVSLVTPPFTRSAIADLTVPCSYDFNVAATKYFDALEAGDLPLCLLFSGTIFYEADDGALQVSQISWEKESEFRLPSTTWRELINHYHPNTVWIGLRKDLFQQLDAFRSARGYPTWEQTFERLVLAAEDPVAT